MKAIYTYSILLAVLLTTGCTATLQSGAEVASIGKSAGLGHLYYTGSDETFHYFAKLSFMCLSSRYRAPRTAYTIVTVFPLTSDKSKWIPYLINGKEKSEGF